MKIKLNAASRLTQTVTASAFDSIVESICHGWDWKCEELSNYSVEVHASALEVAKAFKAEGWKRVESQGELSCYSDGKTKIELAPTGGSTVLTEV